MKKIIAFLLALVLACAMLSMTCFAAEPVTGEIYVKIDGIDGMSDDAPHARWIEGVDYKLNYAEDGTVSGITFTHLIEPATTKIIEYYMKHHSICEAKLNICQYFAGKQYTVLDVYMRYVFITGYEVIQLADGTVAETVTLTADEVTVIEKPLVIGPDGQPILYVPHASGDDVC